MGAAWTVANAADLFAASATAATTGYLAACGCCDATDLLSAGNQWSTRSVADTAYSYTAAAAYAATGNLAIATRWYSARWWLSWFSSTGAGYSVASDRYSAA